MSQQDPYFKDLEETTVTSAKPTHDTHYFTDKPEPTTPTLPETIEADWDNTFDESLTAQTPKRGLKWVIISGISLFVILLGFDIYQFVSDLWQQSKALGSVVAVIIGSLLILILQQLWQFFQGHRVLNKINHIRDKAERMSHEKSHGEAKAWLITLQKVYDTGPQQSLLTPVLADMPDYLNDAEIVSYVSEQFFRKLDHQAMQLIQRESVNSAVLIAVSQLAVMDALLVVWKTVAMVNKLNQIYGIQLSRLGQIRLSLKICRIALLTYASQAGLAFMAEKTSIGLSGKIAGSVAQGIGVGIYQARLGISAMQLIRPIAFTENELPKQRLLSAIVRRSLNKLRH